MSIVKTVQQFGPKKINHSNPYCFYHEPAFIVSCVKNTIDKFQFDAYCIHVELAGK